MPGRILAVCCVSAVAASAAAADQTVARLDELIAAHRHDGLVEASVGVSRRGTPIVGLVSAEAFRLETPKMRILLVGGLDGSPDSVAATLAALDWFYQADAARPWREHLLVSAIACANPDGYTAGRLNDNTSGGNPTRGYPPAGEAYHSATDPEAAYLWRWLAMHAPDLVVEVAVGQPEAWLVPDTVDAPLARLADGLAGARRGSYPGRLFDALARHAAAGVGTIPAVSVAAQTGNPLAALLAALPPEGRLAPSAARRQLIDRLDRTPLVVATQLAEHYGHELATVSYIPALALVGRMRLGELSGDTRHLADVERIVAPYYEGRKPTLAARAGGSEVAGHLVFGELAKATGKPRYVELVSLAADRGFDSQRMPLPAMPAHNEMSDAVFMGCPILAQAGRLTGEARYYDLCLAHLRFMLELNLRADGLHRHSPLDEAAWGRGNGFPALGLALVLAELPADHPIRAETLQAFRQHVAALLPHQDATGCWHQVIDRPESYRELTATCMITFAMARGVRMGWLEAEKYSQPIERGWYAIRTRVAPDGTLVDVCTGTGKQKSLRDYYDRTAILGRDGRGGAMAMMAATEMAAYQGDANR